MVPEKLYRNTLWEVFLIIIMTFPGEISQVLAFGAKS